MEPHRGALLRNRVFRDEYAAARAAYAAGIRTTIFPAGTYWQRRFHSSHLRPLARLRLTSGRAWSSVVINIFAALAGERGRLLLAFAPRSASGGATAAGAA